MASTLLDCQAIYQRPIIRFIPLKPLMVVGALFFVVLFSRVWVKLEVKSLGYRMAEAQQRYVELDMRRRELELELSVLMKGESLRERGKRQLGLTELTPEQFRLIRSE